jgi:hypothetical protein
MSIELFKADLDDLILIAPLVTHPNRVLNRREQLFTRILWQADTRVPEDRFEQNLSSITKLQSALVRAHGVLVYVKSDHSQRGCQRMYSIDTGSWDNRFAKNGFHQDLKREYRRQIGAALAQFKKELLELLQQEISNYYPYIWGYIESSKYFSR